MGLSFGVGLWTMQSTAAAPAPFPTLYREFLDGARLAEDLGYTSMWLAEHRCWYDGWLPSPLVAIAAAASATERLRFGTAMMLLPQHDPVRFAHLARTVDQLSDGRLDIGVGLGHRDAEFDNLGLRRSQRGRRMAVALDELCREDGEPPSVQRPHPPIWVGGMAAPALQRAARRGLGYVLPQTMFTHEVAAAIARIDGFAQEAGRPRGPVAIMRDTWVDSDGDRARAWFVPAIRDHYREESGAWWVLKGSSIGFQQPDLLERQLDRVVGAALVGAPEELVPDLQSLADTGVELVILRFVFDVTRGNGVPEAMALFAEKVAPALAGEG